MEYLKTAWVYRFWIAVGMAALLMPPIGYVANTRSLAASAKRRQTELETVMKNLDSARKGQLPNDEWVKGVDELKTALSKDVDGAWEYLYDRQLNFMTWPKEDNIEEVFRTAGEAVPFPILRAYLIQYSKQIDDLIDRVKPESRLREKGLVYMDENQVKNWAAPWRFGSDPPEVAVAWAAQEDIWVMRAVLDVVARSNADASEWKESKIKQVQTITLFEKAVDQSVGGKTSTEKLVARQGGGDAKGAADKAKSYVSSGDNRLFDQVPVFMEMVVDQRKLVEVVAEFSKSDIPMLVTQVTWNKFEGRLEAPSAKTKASTKADPARGAAPRKEDEMFHLVQLRVWARAFLYKKPDTIKDREKAPAANPSPTPGGAN